ncbi:MAG: DUF4385 domain-containing protein [Anaerolineae bacterium]|nr:DUF4385 domain-containing protein [Anaerolineae bacterium]
MAEHPYYEQDFANIDFRKYPERYQVGKGEQGVLLVEPYKSEILPYWRFKTPEIAQLSADSIYNLFLQYKRDHDFVGMDMARKYLQMGFTRSRRYANHKSGRKYGPDGEELPRHEDRVKAESAAIFYAKYVEARDDPDYQRMRREHQEKYG